METALEMHCSAIHPKIDELTAETVEKAHANGLQVNAWTCNRRSQVEKAVSIGCDGIITNYPDWVRLALGR